MNKMVPIKLCIVLSGVGYITWYMFEEASHLDLGQKILYIAMACIGFPLTMFGDRLLKR